MKYKLARRLRHEQTDVERKLWYELRDRRFCGVKFRRQQPIGSYVVDFVCFERKLIIELDGSQHGTVENREYDAARTEYLRSRGFRVTRYWNVDLIDNWSGVLDAIYRDLHTDTPHPARHRRANARGAPPSPARGEGI